MNKFIASAVLLACVFAANAYNFQDSDYNQFLASQFEDVDSLSLHPRARRDEEAVEKDKCQKKHQFKFCCAEDVLKTIHEQDKPLKKECFKQVTDKDKRDFFHADPFKCDQEKIEKAKEEIHCVAQCMAEKHGTVDAEGKLLEDKVKAKFMGLMEKETYLADKLDAIFTTCIDQGKKAAPKNGEKCSHQILTFGHCLWREVQTSCPADQIKDQKACDRIREHIKAHPESPFPFHHHHHHHDDE